jgi:hypothetical protein
MVSKSRSLAHTGTPTTIPPMPVPIDNGFPTMTLSLGSSLNNPIELTGLLDTCGSQNTGDLTFHMYLASEQPHIVQELRFFNSSDPFEPIKLEGAITDPAGYDSSQHGLLTAVIRYKTSYSDASGNPILISFALGSDVSTNTIIGLPMLAALELQIDLCKFTAYSPTIRHTFPLSRSAGNLGLPSGTSFDVSDFQRRHLDAQTAQRQLPPSHPSAIPASSPLYGTDDYSDGFLRRTVQATTSS